MNILILSAGTRNKIVQYFKEALTDKNGERTGKVIATDMQRIAPAIYDADAFYKVPRMTEPGYIDAILKICKTEKIDGVLSLIDPELSLLAENRQRFADVGTTVIGSSYEVCETALDKMAMYDFCIKNGFRAARSWTELSEFKKEIMAGNIDFPVFIKPQKGSASIAISKVYDMATAELLFDHAKEEEHLMIQEFLDGQEIGADCYIDMVSGKVVSIFTKKKILMRAGETDKAVSFKDEKLFNIIKEFVEKAGYRGQIDIDVFDVNGEYYISEVNPRFGGGYPHAYEAGVDHMTLICNNLMGKANEENIGNYEEDIYMMKYNEVMVKRIEG